MFIHPNNPDVKWVDIRPQLDWRWVDRIDANEWWNYNWKENKTYVGVVEGLVDIFGDKLLGASFDINVIFRDSNIYHLQKGSTGMASGAARKTAQAKTHWMRRCRCTSPKNRWDGNLPAI